MNYIVFDLEWNQPPTEEALVTEPIFLEGEIIEIGAVKLDDSFRPVDELRLYIRPAYYTKLHHRIVSLTGIRDKTLEEEGLPFPEAYEKFRKWCGEECTYVTWSTSDLPMLLDNMMLHGISVEDLPECFDAQRIFSREIMRNDRQYALDDAIKILREKGDVAHDALHDSRNTVKVLNHLDLDQYLNEYLSRVFAELPGETTYESPAAMTADPALAAYTCPWCGEQGTCEDWVSQGHGSYMTRGICPEEDEFLVTLRPMGNRVKGCRAVRLYYEMSDDLWDVYQGKKGEA